MTVQSNHRHSCTIACACIHHRQCTIACDVYMHIRRQPQTQEQDCKRGHNILTHTSGASYLSSVIHTQLGSLSPSSAFHVMSSFFTSLTPTILNSGLPTVSQPSKNNLQIGAQILQLCCLWLFATDLLAWAEQCQSTVVDRDVNTVSWTSNTTADP